MSTSKIICAVATLAVLGACVSPETHRRALSANDALKAQIAELTEYQRKLGKENEQLKSDVERLSKSAKDAAWVESQKQKLDELLKRYQEGSSSAVDGVELVRTSEGLAFRVLGGLLFNPGSVEISEQGRATLGQLMGELTRQGKRIRVDGHTDDQPITHSNWGTNLRLSVERSMAVADFLTKSGIPAEKVSVAGYGEYQPAQPEKSDAARQKNRRVEILMLDR